MNTGKNYGKEKSTDADIDGLFGSCPFRKNWRLG